MGQRFSDFKVGHDKFGNGCPISYLGFFKHYNLIYGAEKNCTIVTVGGTLESTGLGSHREDRKSENIERWSYKLLVWDLLTVTKIWNIANHQCFMQKYHLRCALWSYRRLFTSITLIIPAVAEGLEGEQLNLVA